MARSLRARLRAAFAAVLDLTRAGGRENSRAVREEVKRLAADQEDREEMRIVREQLAELAPRLPD